MTPGVSILLLSWNTRELTLECLDSLPASVDDDLTYETIVVDNGSRDASAEALAKRTDIRLITNRENRGYAAAVNQAYAYATSELILLLNSDIRFAPGALSALRRFLRQREDVAGVGPLYLNPDGSPQQHHYRLPTFATQLGSVSSFVRHLPPVARRMRRYRMLDDDFTQPCPVPQPSASCLLLRRACLPERELLDERYPIYFNDVALARWLASRGRALWMTPDAVVFHEHGASTRLLGGALRRQYLGALVRYLAASEPRYRLLAWRTFVLLQGLLSFVLRRPEALHPGDLWKAVAGDPGPLPQVPLET